EGVRPAYVDVSASAFVGLPGPNGPGKTTTFRKPGAMTPPADGSVPMNGVDLPRRPMFQRARLGMGYLSQEPSIFRHMTVRENLLAVLEALGMRRAERQTRALELIAEFGIEHVTDSVAVNLSGGERRRLELARTL